MTVCDRCQAPANQVRLLPGRAVDLCDRCEVDLRFMLDAFLSSKDFNVLAVPVNALAAPDLVTTPNVIVK